MDSPQQNNELADMDDKKCHQSQNSVYMDQKHLFDFVSTQIQREVSGIQCPPIRLFVTGKAGTDMSLILKLIAEYIDRGYSILNPKESHRYVNVCAYTGVAALDIGGQTLHSAFNFSVSQDTQADEELFDYCFEKMQEHWRHIRFIIISEISMVSYEMLYKIHCRLQELKCNDNLFGGVNVLLFGDLMQLPPISGTPVFIQPRQMEGEPHLFQQFKFCELNEIICPRSDSSFINLLNNLREGNLTVDQYKLLVSKAENSKQQGDFALGKALRIVPTNRMVNNINEFVINNISPNIEKFDIVAQDVVVNNVRSVTNIPLERIIPTNINETAGVARQLTLFSGLKVMLKYNVNVERGLVNGARGEIVAILFPGGSQDNLKHDIPQVVIKIDNSKQVEIIKPITVTFDAYYGYTVQRRMLPIVPCYALTVHKIQGSTINKAVINLGRNYFTHGQKFVALSCCKTLADIEIDEISPEGLIEGEVCNKEALEEMNRLKNLTVFNEECN